MNRVGSHYFVVAQGVLMTDARFLPVVAIDLDGVLRIPNTTQGSEFRTGVYAVQITMRRATFPSYTHTEPDWDGNGTWTGTHTFTSAGAEWVRAMHGRGIEVVWTTRWLAYANVYFSAALDVPDLPFTGSAEDWDDSGFTLVAVHSMSRRFAGRPLLWVRADAGPADRAALYEFRRGADRPRTRLYVPDRTFGITESDAVAMDQWLDLARTPAGQEELRRAFARRMRQRRTAAEVERWGTEERFRRWRATRSRLAQALEPDATLLTVLTDYAVERGDDVSRAEVAQLREEWGCAGDPAPDELLALLTPVRGRKPDTELTAWVGQGYPPGLRDLVTRLPADAPALAVGRGWWPLLRRLDEQLARVDPDYTVTALRSVDGYLRFDPQVSSRRLDTPAFREPIRRAQEVAARTCERCARVGCRREGIAAHVVVLCDEHARPLSDDELASALEGGVPPEVFTAEGAVDGALSGPGTQ